VGPKVGPINPVFSLTISNAKGKTLDDLIKEKDEFLKKALKSGNLEIISQEKSTVNEKQAYVTNARGLFQSNGTSYNVQFREVIISTPEKFYTFAYSNGVDNFTDQISRFEESVNSFKIISEPIKETESITETQIIFIILGIIVVIGIVVGVILMKKRKTLTTKNDDTQIR
ncbi:MAG: hypothetical protein Q7R33_10035, partial [Nitrosarchaeum sp.]|nr:hypothetical protein [Nitrosarchaeum sp.]